MFTRIALVASVLLAPLAAHATGPQSVEAKLAGQLRKQLPGVSGIKTSNVTLKPYGKPNGAGIIKYKYTVKNVVQKEVTPGRFQNFEITLKEIKGTAWKTNVKGNGILIKSAKVQAE